MREVRVKPGTNPGAKGSRAHALFKAKIDAIRGNNAWTEKSFLKGDPMQYGTSGTIRVDYIDGAPGMKPYAIYDLKTGSAGLTPARIAAIRAHLPPGWADVPIIPIHP